MINGVGQRIRELRRKAELSQEQLAEKFGVSVQAVSKWECSQSYPDIELLRDIAGTFGVTVDYILNGAQQFEAAEAVPVNEFPDDGVIRIVQYRGSKLIRKDDYDPNFKIPLEITDDTECTVNVEIWGSAKIDGNVQGNINAGGSISCCGVVGEVNSGGSVNCNGVVGNVNSGGAVNCNGVVGDISAGGNVCCDDVAGNVSACGNVECDDVEGNVKADGDVDCDDIKGDVYCKGDVTCDNVKGNVTAEGKVEIN
ncbi:MAG: helix-turn-helix domain-containing protein [Oscillospiraceae bacterium]|nr:helix-turn-helix domain-containing protein [Oscillospiraceae bacterium]